MKACIAISVFLSALLDAGAQSGAVEHYYFTRTRSSESLMTPMAHFTSANNWYGEARYNFDELNTFSLYAGRKFSGGRNLSWEATPVVGGLMGQMTGGSLGMNVGMDFKKIFFSSQSQYSFSMENSTDKYFFNWTEVGYSATPWMYAGLAMQQTNVYRTQGKLEPGCMVGFSIKNWTIPLYAFNTSDQERYFVLGLNWQWDTKKRKNKIEQVLTSEPSTNKNE
jgi:hypothetical protein